MLNGVSPKQCHHTVETEQNTPGRSDDGRCCRMKEEPAATAPRSEQ